LHRWWKTPEIASQLSALLTPAITEQENYYARSIVL